MLGVSDSKLLWHFVNVALFFDSGLPVTRILLIADDEDDEPWNLNQIDEDNESALNDVNERIDDEVQLMMPIASN